MTGSLAARVAVITGLASGIGHATALAFAQGARLRAYEDQLYRHACALK